MNIFARLFLAALLGLVSTQAHASDCVSQLPNKTYPVFTNQAFRVKAQVFCFQEFTVYWSGQTRTPLYVGEYLTPSRMQRAEPLVRQGEFYEDRRLGSNGAKMGDYRRSGFDRGHMAPSADMSSYTSQQESFNLVNIIPQNSVQNRNQWANIEHATRTMAYKEPIYVITGVLFEGAQIQALNNRVLIPTTMYKLIYIPSKRQAAAYVLANEANARIMFEDVATLERRAQISFGLGQVTRLHLPNPKRR